MESFPVQEAVSQLQKLMAQASIDHRHFKITSEEGNVVMIPEETYNNLLITLEVLSIPGLQRCLEDNANEGNEDLFDLDSPLIKN